MSSVIPQHEPQYNLRARPHDRLLIPKTADLNDRDFIVRMLAYMYIHHVTSSLTSILFSNIFILVYSLLCYVSHC